jgi:hypothetical protein
VRCHRDVAALRVTGDEELAVVGVARGQASGQRGTRRNQPIDHVLGLLLAVQVRVIGQRRAVVAGVVGRDDDVALRREHRGDQRALGPALVGLVQDVGDVVAVRGRCSMRVDKDGQRATAAGASGRRHDRARRGRRFPLASDRLVLEIMKVDAALGRTGKGEQLLARRTGIQLGGERCRVERGHAQGRIFYQRPLDGAGIDYRSGRSIVARGERAGP